MAQTVMNLNNVWVQEIAPLNLAFVECDCPKRDAGYPNYFNGGFFAELAGGKTIPVGNLANNGVVLAQAVDNEGWINLSNKKLTTVVVLKDGSASLQSTNRLDNIANLKTAISGIPIIIDGKAVSRANIKKEGYFGSELYDTWHSFLGLREKKLVYVAAQCDFDQMVWIMVALGIYNAIKLDGGGSFILYNARIIEVTSGNRRINNVGLWG